MGIAALHAILRVPATTLIASSLDRNQAAPADGLRAVPAGG